MTEKECLKAIAVADRRLKANPEFHALAERRVFAKHQAGFDFYRGLHKEMAQGMWREAVVDCKAAIRPPEELGSRERRSALICLDMLGEYGERNRYLRQGRPSILMIRKLRDSGSI
jgi:hypothetical protein